MQTRTDTFVAALCFLSHGVDPLPCVLVARSQLWFTPGGQLVPGSAENVSAAEVRACVRVCYIYLGIM